MIRIRFECDASLENETCHGIIGGRLDGLGRRKAY